MTGAESAAQIVALLGLKPHPEGGHFAETFVDPATAGARPASSAIYYLLQRDEYSAWHRIDTAEVWHWYAGAPLLLKVAGEGGRIEHRLGTDLVAGERPQAVVPARAWMAAESLGGFTLVGCTVAPAFRFEAFELAPKGWEP